MTERRFFFAAGFFGCGGVASIHLAAASKAGSSLGKGLGMVAKPPSNNERDADLSLYAGLMDEVKLRLSAIETGLGTMGALLPAELRHEFCYLQLRMICELIAMACLVAHGDIRASKHGKSLIAEWSAPDIMKTLQKIHPRFFPNAITLDIKPGHTHMEAKPEASGYLTRDEFLILYGRAGNALHRGTVKKLMSGKPYKAGDPPEIVRWANSIVRLLDQHHIPATDNLSHWVCGLKGPDGKAFVAYAESPTPQQFGPVSSKTP